MATVTTKRIPLMITCHYPEDLPPPSVKASTNKRIPYYIARASTHMATTTKGSTPAGDMVGMAVLLLGMAR